MRTRRTIQNVTDKTELFLKCQSAVYLERMLDIQEIEDDNFFQMLGHIIGAELYDLHARLSPLVKKPGDENSIYRSDGDEADDLDDAARMIIRIYRAQTKGRRKTILKDVADLLIKYTSKAERMGRSEPQRKIDQIAKMFNLTENEKAMVTFLYVMAFCIEANDYFVDHLNCQRITKRRILKTILAQTNSQINQALHGTLEKMQFYEIGSNHFHMSDDFQDFCIKSNKDMGVSRYYKRFSGKTIPLEAHHVEKETTDHILKLLSEKRQASNHILLYGRPGTGKSSYALGIANTLGIPSYEITREVENRAKNRRAAILACLNTTNNRDGSLIVVDEADNLLNTEMSWFVRGETQDKGWLNQILDEPQTRMIWITNDIDGIDPSVLRRFAFSLNFPSFNRSQREALWKAILKRHGLRKLFTDETVARLASRYDVSAAVIDMAVRKALESCPDKDSRLKELLEMNLDAYLTLKHRGVKKRKADDIERNYSIDGLNIEGDLPAIIDQLVTFDGYLRKKDQGDVRNFNMVFYGPPGAGKSELARFIATRLKRELLVKRASDIVSLYVGETEKNISRVFTQAENMEAVLVIDEADSFLYERARAGRSWEISHTNEFLTQMERFRGILICTTNRFNDLDSASLRRFNHKIGFRELTPEGNQIFYKKLLGLMTDEDLTTTQNERLGLIRNLTPGDFRVVRDRFAVMEKQRVTHEGMIDALSQEARIKGKQQNTRPIGFMR